MRVTASSIAKQADRTNCPIRSQIYGGIPGGGGYGPNKELEIGAQIAAEAAHCILGSLGNNLHGNDDWDNMISVEGQHIKEEMGIINHVMEEYSKDLYTDQINISLEDYKPEYVERAKKYIDGMIQSVRENSPALASLASANNQAWAQQEDVPPALHAVGTLCYSFLEVLANSFLEAVSPFPDMITNPFQNQTLIQTAAELDQAVSMLFIGE